MRSAKLKKLIVQTIALLTRQKLQTMAGLHNVPQSVPMLIAVKLLAIRDIAMEESAMATDHVKQRILQKMDFAEQFVLTTRPHAKTQTQLWTVIVQKENAVIIVPHVIQAQHATMATPMEEAQIIHLVKQTILTAVIIAKMEHAKDKGHAK